MYETLHSNMSQFKPYAALSSTPIPRSLHSNMSQFKPIASSISWTTALLYIPICLNLNNWMDMRTSVCDGLYIPICLNLNEKERNTWHMNKFLYIPICLNLNDTRYFHDFILHRSLHSNMSQFKLKSIKLPKLSITLYIPICLNLNW